jgi:putative glutamine amidotransferase
MTHRPLILLSPDYEIRALSRGPTPFFTLEENYGTAVWNAEGNPCVVPYTEDNAKIHSILDQADGLVLTGGDFDIDPELFDEMPHPSLGTIKKNRTLFERQLHDGACARGIPILGICGGMQLMNVLRSGTLWQDIGSQANAPLNHEQAAPKNQADHLVELVESSQLHQLVGVLSLPVNSTHHQAVREVGDRLMASASAPDGIVEAIEDPALPFYLGVQWHPEAMDDPRQLELYRGLVQAARNHHSIKGSAPNQDVDSSDRIPE